MKRNEHLMTCVAEEGVEIALELSKVACKTGRFGVSNRSILNPTGPTNVERLVSEVNDLIAVMDMLVEAGQVPVDWRDTKAQEVKRAQVRYFIEYGKQHGTIDD